MPGHRQRQALFPRQTWCAVVPHHQVTPTWSADWKLHLTALESCSRVVTCQQWWPCTDFLFLVHLLCISKCVFFFYLHWAFTVFKRIKGRFKDLSLLFTRFLPEYLYGVHFTKHLKLADKWQRKRSAFCSRPGQPNNFYTIEHKPSNPHSGLDFACLHLNLELAGNQVANQGICVG